MFADQQPPHADVSPQEPEVVAHYQKEEPQAHAGTQGDHEPETEVLEEQKVGKPLRRSDIGPLPSVYGEGDNLRAGTDHGVWFDGKYQATLLASWYPDEFSLRKKKKAFRDANPSAKIQVRTLHRLG